MLLSAAVCMMSDAGICISTHSMPGSTQQQHVLLTGLVNDSE